MQKVVQLIVCCTVICVNGTLFAQEMTPENLVDTWMRKFPFFDCSGAEQSDQCVRQYGYSAENETPISVTAFDSLTRLVNREKDAVADILAQQVRTTGLTPAMVTLTRLAHITGKTLLDAVIERYPEWESKEQGALLKHYVSVQGAAARSWIMPYLAPMKKPRKNDWWPDKNGRYNEAGYEKARTRYYAISSLQSELFTTAAGTDLQKDIVALSHRFSSDIGDEWSDEARLAVCRDLISRYDDASGWYRWDIPAFCAWRGSSVRSGYQNDLAGKDHLKTAILAMMIERDAKNDPDLDVILEWLALIGGPQGDHLYKFSKDSCFHRFPSPYFTISIKPHISQALARIDPGSVQDPDCMRGIFKYFFVLEDIEPYQMKRGFTALGADSTTQRERWGKWLAGLELEQEKHREERLDIYEELSISLLPWYDELSLVADDDYQKKVLYHVNKDLGKNADEATRIAWFKSAVGNIHSLGPQSFSYVWYLFRSNLDSCGAAKGELFDAFVATLSETPDSLYTSLSYDLYKLALNSSPAQRETLDETVKQYTRKHRRNHAVRVFESMYRFARSNHSDIEHLVDALEYVNKEFEGESDELKHVDRVIGNIMISYADDKSGKAAAKPFTEAIEMVGKKSDFFKEWSATWAQRIASYEPFCFSC